MIRRISWLAASLACLSGTAVAQEEPKPPYTLSANVFLVSDYFFRGITQTWGKPAVQGGFDFVHESGVYLGTWASNVSGNQFANGSLEWDFYGGYNFKPTEDITLGAGLLYYYYPGANYDQAAAGGPNQTFNTLEVNVSATYKWITAKVSYALTDYFGANTKTGYLGDTDGTYYPEVNVSYPLPFLENLSLIAHVGYTNFKEELAAPNVNGETDPSYADWKIGLSYVWKDGWIFGAYYVDTSNDDFYKNTASFANSQLKDLGGAGGYVTVGRTF
jgi:uncharacterized protein (TIGR02001 family)